MPRSSTAVSDLVICFFASTVYSISKYVSELQRPGSDCSSAQYDQGLCFSHAHRGPLLSDAVQSIK